METPPSIPLWFSKRFLVSFVLFLCFVNFQILRNNVNITVVEMTSNKTITRGNLTITEPAEFDWDSITIGLVLSILAYGGLLSFLGGFLVDWLGGAMTTSLCLFMGGLTTILHPIALRVDFRLFLACRFVSGIFESLFYVSVIDIFVRWFPKNERSALISFSFNGTNVGVAVVYPLCGYLAYTWGWQVAFYVTGCMSVFTSCLCLIVVKNSPSQDKFISKNELNYILKETEFTSSVEINHPYRSILTSGPVWALCMVLFSYMWLSTVLGSCLPLYIKDLTQKNTNEIGLITSIPNIVFIITFPIAGTVMNYWNNHSNVTLTRIHKIMIIFACISSAAILVGMTMFTDFSLILISIVAIQITTPFMPLIVEIIPGLLNADSSSVIYSLVSVFFSLSALMSQNSTSFIVKDHDTQEWNNCFYMTSSILLVAAVINTIFGSSEKQPWSLPPISKNDRKQSVINIQFSNDVRKMSARSISLQVRRVSINNSELQNRVRRMSMKSTDLPVWHRKQSTGSIDLRKKERKFSLEPSLFTKYERRSSIILEECQNEEDESPSPSALSHSETDHNQQSSHSKLPADREKCSHPGRRQPLQFMEQSVIEERGSSSEDNSESPCGRRSSFNFPAHSKVECTLSDGAQSVTHSILEYPQDQREPSLEKCDNPDE